MKRVEEGIELWKSRKAGREMSCGEGRRVEERSGRVRKQEEK